MSLPKKVVLLEELYKFFVFLKNKWSSVLPTHLDFFFFLFAGEGLGLCLEVELVQLNFSVK